jgi:hypothetical protein
VNTRLIYLNERLDRTNREAMALVEAERKARLEKTERLRAMRLAEAPNAAKLDRNKGGDRLAPHPQKRS